MTLIDPPPLDRYSPRSEIVGWINRLKSFEPDEYGMRDFYISVTEDVLAEHDELVAKGKIKE